MPLSAQAIRASAPAVGLFALAAALALVLALAVAPPSIAASRATAPTCTPAAVDSSAALAGGAITVSPAPDTRDASFRTQISFLGVPAAELVDLKVSGSRSGSHSGRLSPYSQGDGASFIPDKPFTQGEFVSVHATLRQGASPTPFAWRFTVAEIDAASHSLETPPPPPPPPKPNEYQHFVSRPDMRPPAVTVTTNTGAQAAGDIFLAPYAGPGQYGPMILDGGGGLLWFKPIPTGSRAADLRVQEYEGRPALTWWQDPLIAAGRRDAGVVIADDAYKDIAIVRAGNGYHPDLHAFDITSQNTALFTVYDAIRCNLRAQGGPANGAVADTLIQELDLKTGLVRFEWHSLDHVALANSYMPIGHAGGTPPWPWDWFHINAVFAAPDGRLLIDSRNTWAAYDVEPHGAQVVWTLGGKHSSFAMGPGASPAWQHDARERADGTISFFDNGGTPKVHSQSRVLVDRLDLLHMTATLVSSYNHSAPLLAASQGDSQPLPGGNWLVGWGQAPYFSEFAPQGNPLFDAHLPFAYQSYTVFKFPWLGSPTQSPALAVRSVAHGHLVVYASWNGATTVARWQLLGGGRRQALIAVRVAPTVGFETAIPLSAAPRYVAVQALDAAGHVLGTSAIAHT